MKCTGVNTKVYFVKSFAAFLLVVQVKMIISLVCEMVSSVSFTIKKIKSGNLFTMEPAEEE